MLTNKSPVTSEKTNENLDRKVNQCERQSRWSYEEKEQKPFRK
jgi:hypothetical protein